MVRLLIQPPKEYRGERRILERVVGNSVFLPLSWAKRGYDSPSPHAKRRGLPLESLIGVPEVRRA